MYSNLNKLRLNEGNNVPRVFTAKEATLYFDDNNIHCRNRNDVHFLATSRFTSSFPIYSFLHIEFSYNENFLKITFNISY